MRARVPFCKGDAVGAVAGRDVEHSRVAGLVQRGERCRSLRGGDHHRGHHAGELDPGRVVRRGRAVFRGVEAAEADGRGEVGESLGDGWREEELRRIAAVRRGVPVEEYGGGRRGRVAVALLREEAVDGEVVAEDADSALGTFAACGDLRRRGRRGADDGENAKLQGCLQRRRPVVGIDRFKKELR